ncbi:MULTISPECIES: organomercurial lyase MerB [Acinetobacter]|uniref:Alkylmercury lyase n=5 Tax=Acinetobacter TaxID=469 RepID=A0A2S2F980_9GAMM|nr:MULTISPECIES: organomercurial lyase MerB [Acinetobacter]NWK50240.1 organomercurial lyase MerB [Acinetobacter sp. SwsAc7]WEI20984.1 organomercurial lyase MerB [Acinetobacter bereziniae]ALV74863.1 alkylmercury lyase [Acinetobacter johnsonii XBB1]AWL27448.1 organomercurial lyase MerB [Acinetobacter defluvii]AYA67310.1 organomercurial lyase MerB [Acinetobacter sp. WCHA55]
METSTFVKEIAERFSVINRLHPTELLLPLLREIAKGSPVSRKTLATVLDWPADRVAAALDQVPSTEYDDDGNIVGYGLTLRETPHTFEIDGQRLYTWCALDVLIFPALLGRSAYVSSRCPTTGEEVSLTVAPDGLHRLEPASAVVSLVRPNASSDIRCSFCCHVHFFASAAAADDWVAQHEGAEVVGVEEAFRLGQELARQLSSPSGT